MTPSQTTPTADTTTTKRRGRYWDPEQARAAGRKGGASTRARYGAEHFRALGKRGGAGRAAQLGDAGYSALGHKGGTETHDRHGRDHYVAMGRKGGTRRGANQRARMARASAERA